MARTKKTKLEFPVKTYTVTDKYGNVETHTTRQTTIGKIIWTDADIKYYEELQKLIAKAKRLNKKIDKLCGEVKEKTTSEMVDELIEEIEQEPID